MQIEVRPIEKKRWHGKEGKDSFARPIKIQALVNPDNSKYSVVMTDDDKEFLSNNGYDLEELHLNYNREKPHPFWDSGAAQVKLENNTQIYRTENVTDRLKICIMKGSKFVANSMTDYIEGRFPEATHVIYSEEEDVKVKASKIAIEEDAVLGARKAGDKRKIEIIMILAGKDATGKSPDFIAVEMKKLITNDASAVLNLLEEDSDKVSTQALVRKAITNNTIVLKGHKYMYHEALIGNSEDEAIRYLNKDENQELRIMIEQKVND